MADLNIRLNLGVTPGLFRWGLAVLSVTAFATDLSSESVVLSTYYPAPTGIYTQMITTGNTFLARDGGNVGVALAGAATTKLEVGGNTNLLGAAPSASFAAGATLSSPGASTLALGTSGAERLRISNQGLVGIGTTNPQLAVHVNGDIVGRTWNLTLAP